MSIVYLLTKKRKKKAAGIIIHYIPTIRTSNLATSLGDCLGFVFSINPPGHGHKIK